jgi:hypothetical protein
MEFNIIRHLVHDPEARSYLVWLTVFKTVVGR